MVYWVSMADLKGKKILIVEDDTLLHSLLADKMADLREQGVEVYPTLNADEALAAVATFVPDLILLDLVMPGKNGFEFLQALRKMEHFEHTPVIVLSNLSQEEDRARAKELGVVKFLVKADFSLDEISKEVTSALAGIVS